MCCFTVRYSDIYKICVALLLGILIYTKYVLLYRWVFCRLLKEKNRDGTYLIRGGSHAGAEKVLSVWHIDRCRHYKLFKDEAVRMISFFRG